MLIQLKHSGNTGNVPLTLANGELALNYADQLLYYKHANGSIVAIANGASIGLDQIARDTANGAFTKANGAAQFSFTTINVASQSDIVADSNTDTLTLVSGPGINITTDAPNDTITISSTTGSINTFFTINVAGQSDIVADSNTDTLTFVAGESILLTTDAANDALTIAVTALNGGTF
jgi:hypothetical protein